MSVKPKITTYIASLLVLLLFIFKANAQTEENIFQGVNTVVIDPGHGGKDPGCHGSSSNEKDIVLSIALKLGKYIQENVEGVKVIYTRDTDVFLELEERAQIANRNHADLFISIHANAAAPGAYGTETFVMGISKTKSNLEVAKRENSVILMEDDYHQTYGEFDPNSPESYIALSLMQSANIGQSLSFAAKVQEQFRERVGRRDRGVKQAGFWVLHRTSMPSVLIETGFVTHAEEEKFLKSQIGQEYLASAMYRAFKAYKEEIESKIIPLPTEMPAGKVVVEKTAEAEEAESENKPEREQEEGLIFKVQLVTSSKKITTEPENFKGLSGVEYYKAGGLYRYTVGNEQTWEAAGKLQEQVKTKGFEDAFIVAFLNGKRIAVGEAVKLLKKNL